MNSIALILAAGSSTRFGKHIPKVYHNIALHSKSALQMSVEAFAEHPSIDGVFVVISEKDIELYSQAGLDSKILGYTFGSDTRKKSVLNGLKALLQYSPAKVLIHDAARPFITSDIIDRVLAELDIYDAVDVLMPVVDTLKIVKNEVTEMMDRSHLYQTQTPQGFKFQEIYDLHCKDSTDYLDDISLFLNHNKKVGSVSGSAKNYKITFAGDL